jgi:hypothetical protein
MNLGTLIDAGAGIHGAFVAAASLRVMWLYWNDESKLLRHIGDLAFSYLGLTMCSIWWLWFHVHDEYWPAIILAIFYWRGDIGLAKVIRRRHARISKQ